MSNSNAEYALMTPTPSYRMQGGQNRNTQGAGTNHPGGVGTYYYLSEYDEKKDTLSLTYLNNAGDTIRNFSTHSKDKATKLKDIKVGANKHRWNMKYADAKGFDGMILWWGSTSGATVVPGEYQVHMRVNGFNESRTFKILGDPRLEISADSYMLQQEFIESVNTKVTEAHEAIIEMRDLKNQMKEFKSSHKDSVITIKIEEIDSVLTMIEKELYQTKNKSRQDPLNFPIRLTNKLAHINSLVQIGDGAPPKQMYEVRDELTGRIDSQLSKYEAIKKDLPELNKLIREHVTDFIKVSEK